MAANDMTPREFTNHVVETFAELNADILVAHVIATYALQTVIRSSRWREDLFDDLRAKARRTIENAPFAAGHQDQDLRERTIQRALARLDKTFAELAPDAKP